MPKFRELSDLKPADLDALELDPTKRYLFVFKETTDRDVARAVKNALAHMGISGLFVLIEEGAFRIFEFDKEATTDE